MDSPENADSNRILSSGTFIPIYMADAPKDLNLDTGCSKTECRGEHLEL